MRAKQEEHTEDCSKPFNEVFNEYVNRYPDIFMANDAPESYKVSDWRGKVIIF